MTPRLRLQPEAVIGQGMTSQRVRNRLVERLREAGIGDENVLNAIRTVAAGDAVVAPSTTRRLLDHVVPTLSPTPGEHDPRLALLTEREREVLLEVAGGSTNAEIAKTLYMAEGTVKTHIGRLLTKLQARDRVGLVLFAYENGLVGR